MALQSSIARVANLRCDVLITVHPDFVGLAAKRDALVAAEETQAVRAPLLRADVHESRQRRRPGGEAEHELRNP